MFSRKISTMLYCLCVVHRFRVLGKAPARRGFQKTLTGALLCVNIPVKLRFSVATVNDVVLRDTGGTLNATYITTFATTVHVGVFYVYPLRDLNVTVTACDKRGCNTKGPGHV